MRRAAAFLAAGGFFLVLYPLRPPSPVSTHLFAVALLNTEVATGIGTLIAPLFDERATTIAILYVVFIMCAGGYFVNLRNMRVGELPALLELLVLLDGSLCRLCATHRCRPRRICHALTVFFGMGWMATRYDVAALLGFVLVQRVRSS